MQISHHSPKFTGVSLSGKEPDVVKQNKVDSASFQLHGKRYTAWDNDRVTLEKANSAYNQATLTRPFETDNGSGLLPTQNKSVLRKAEDELRKVYKNLVRKAN